MTPSRTWVVAAVVAALGGAGCSGIRASQARDSHMKEQLVAYVFPVPCEELWVDALKVIAYHDFKMVGDDRKLVGQDPHGAIGRFMARGHPSHRDDKGVFESESDADNAQVRYRVRGTPEGEKGCRVEYTGIKMDRMDGNETYWREYDYELELMARISPADASRISLGMDEAAAKAAK
jgi:hypothetical protein